MLRTLISIYKTMFFIYCGLMLSVFLLLGLFMAIEGTNSSARWSGLGLMIGGVFITVFLAGSLAIMLENNELLRKIASNVEPDNGVDKKRIPSDHARVEPRLQKSPVTDEQL